MENENVSFLEGDFEDLYAVMETHGLCNDGEFLARFFKALVNHSRSLNELLELTVQAAIGVQTQALIVDDMAIAEKIKQMKEDYKI
jgi:hypothetical protein